MRALRRVQAIQQLPVWGWLVYPHAQNAIIVWDHWLFSFAICNHASARDPDLIYSQPPPPIKSTDGITVCLIHVTELNQHGDISVIHASKLNKNMDSLAKRNTNWASFSLCVATDGFCLKLRLSALFNSSSFLRIWTYPGTYSTPNAFVHSYRFDAGLYSILYVNKVAAGMLSIIIFLFCFLHNIDYWRISF